MARYRKRPIVIEAEQWFPWVHTIPEVEEVETGDAITEVIGRIRTLEDIPGSYHYVMPGDWIIRGIQGEVYAVKPDIFKATYEPA